MLPKKTYMILHYLFQSEKHNLKVSIKCDKYYNNINTYMMVDVVQGCSWWNDWSGRGNELKKVHRSWEKVRGFAGIEGAMKGKRCGHLSLDSLGQLGSLSGEIWERMRFQIWILH